MSINSIEKALPVGALPMNSPFIVPLMMQRVDTLLSLDTMSWGWNFRSGKAVRNIVAMVLMLFAPLAISGEGAL